MTASEPHPGIPSALYLGDVPWTRLQDLPVTLGMRRVAAACFAPRDYPPASQCGFSTPDGGSVSCDLQFPCSCLARVTRRPLRSNFCHSNDQRRCFVCGVGDVKLVAVTRMLDAHNTCFCTYQCRAVLQSGSAEHSPAADGRWLVDWQASIDECVTPECSAAVKGILEERKQGFEGPTTSAQIAVYQQLKAAATESLAAFGQLAMLV